MAEVERPEPGAEANMIRDEMRAAIRGLDAATQRVIAVIGHAESFLRTGGRPPRITGVAPRDERRITTPAERQGAPLRE